MHFEQKNSNKLNFVINSLKKYFQEKVIFLLIVHVKRNFNLEKKEKLYSVLDIYENTNQIFIDNLNGEKS